MEARITNLIKALRASGDPVQFDLAGRLWRCQQQREERRTGLRDRVDRPCRSVACEHCRRWRGREWRERAVVQMRNADNENSSMVTVVLERTGDLPTVRDVVRDFRVDLRNLRNRRVRDDARWRKLEAVGLCELDMLAVEEICLLPPLRRAVIGALPVRSHADRFTVVVHVHLAVSHPMIPRHVVERALRQQWQGAGRVDVREFRDDATGPENAGGIVAYASKHRMTTKFDGVGIEVSDPLETDAHEPIEVPVPVEWQAAYWGWLHGIGAGLAPLRVRMSAMRDPVSGDDVTDDVTDEEPVEPMPVLIGSW